MSINGISGRSAIPVTSSKAKAGKAQLSTPSGHQALQPRLSKQESGNRPPRAASLDLSPLVPRKGTTPFFAPLKAPSQASDRKALNESPQDVKAARTSTPASVPQVGIQPQPIADEALLGKGAAFCAGTGPRPSDEELTTLIADALFHALEPTVPDDEKAIAAQFAEIYNNALQSAKRASQAQGSGTPEELRELAQVQHQLLGLQHEQATMVADSPLVDDATRALFAARAKELEREIALNQRDPEAAAARLELVTTETNVQLLDFLATCPRLDEARRQQCAEHADVVRADLQDIRAEMLAPKLEKLLQKNGQAHDPAEIDAAVQWASANAGDILGACPPRDDGQPMDPAAQAHVLAYSASWLLERAAVNEAPEQQLELWARHAKKEKWGPEVAALLVQEQGTLSQAQLAALRGEVPQARRTELEAKLKRHEQDRASATSPEMIAALMDASNGIRAELGLEIRNQTALDAAGRRFLDEGAPLHKNHVLELLDDAKFTANDADALPHTREEAAALAQRFRQALQAAGVPERSQDEAS